MSDLKGIHIAYFGDWVFYTGPNFIESPFEMVAKDCHLEFLGKPVTDAFEAAGATIESYSNWQLYRMSPEDYRAILDRSDVIVVSDVERVVSTSTRPSSTSRFMGRRSSRSRTG